MEKVANTLHKAVVVTENTDEWKKLLVRPVKMYRYFETKLIALPNVLSYILVLYLQSCIFTFRCISVLLQNGPSE